MMPRDTLRIVAPVRSTNSSVRSVAIRRMAFLTDSTSPGPGKNRNPETKMPMMNLAKSKPAVPAMASTLEPITLSCSAHSPSSALMLVEARYQI